MIGVIENIFTKVFSEKNLKTFEKIILVSATLGFIVHLILILLNNNGYIDLSFFHGLNEDNIILARLTLCVNI